MNKTADTLPKFQTDYMFIRTVAESKIQPCIFQQIHLPSIGSSVRWICALKIHSATRRQNAIPIFARNSVSLLCMFGESVFALITDHEVRAAKLTNRWISGCLWGRDASSDEHLVGTKQGLLKCRSVHRKPPGEQWSRRETVESRGPTWNFDVEMDSGISGPLLLHVQMKGCQRRRTGGDSHSTST